MNNKLTIPEALALSRCEKVIAKGQQIFIEVGNAVLQIRDERLYRKNYGSFNQYCEERWGWGERRASQIIQAASVVQRLPKESSTMVPTERVARAVAQVSEEKRPQVIAAAAKATNGHVTAKAITAAAKVIDVEEVLQDSVGREIPAQVSKYWNRSDEIKDLLKQITNVKRAIEKAHEAKDLMYAEISNAAIGDLERAWHSIQCGVPYAVCPQCQGHPEVQPKGECRLCLGRGLISKFRWKAVPEETRNMIEKQVNK